MTDKTTTTTIPALLPCPFCGAEAELLKTIDQHSNYPRHWLIQCENGCACAETDGLEPDEAVAAWNRRAAPSPAAAAPSAARPDYSHLRPEGGRFSFAYSPDTELPWVGWRFDDRDAAHFFRMELDALRNEEIFPAPAQPSQGGSVTEAAKRIAWALQSEDTRPLWGDADGLWNNMSDAAKAAHLSAARASAPAAPEVLKDEVVAAACALGAYDDFGEPDECPHCGPKNPGNYNAARMRLYQALRAFRDHPWNVAALRSAGEAK